MSWWIWVLLGLTLLAAEMIVPGGVILLFFGASALVVGLLVALGMGGPVAVQLALFSILSVVSLLTLRGPILRRIKPSNEDSSKIDSLVDASVVVSTALDPGAEGKAELRGSSWTARNVGSRSLEAGETAVVERVEGLTLHIKEVAS